MNERERYNESERDRINEMSKRTTEIKKVESTKERKRERKGPNETERSRISKRNLG